MSNGHHEEQNGAAGDELAARLKEATELLESVVRDRGLLGTLSVEERTRLVAAAGDVYNPDLVQRRVWGKAVRRREKAAKLARDESALADTGIRVLREKPVYTTPNIVPPLNFEQSDRDEPELRELIEPQHCYVCKERYAEIHPFYDQLCPSCGELNYRKRTETADLCGRVALLTGGRVKIGYQAGIKLLRAGAHVIVHDAVPARRRDAVCAGARLRGLGRPPGDLRARPPPHAERRRFLRAPENDPRPARLHRQQRVPDRAPAVRVLPAHARRRARVGAHDARGASRAARRV